MNDEKNFPGKTPDDDTVEGQQKKQRAVKPGETSSDSVLGSDSSATGDLPTETSPAVDSSDSSATGSGDGGGL